MQTNLGRCYYGRDDDATLVGARPDRPGWIGVCDRHRDEAGADGYVLHELVRDDRSHATRPPDDRRVDAASYDAAVRSSVGLDILDDPYPEEADGAAFR